MSKFEFPKNNTPIVINSHPRSGTHLLIDFIRRQYKETSIKKTWDRGLDDLYFSIEALLNRQINSEITNKKGLRVLSSCKAPIVKYHIYSKSTLESDFPEWMKYLLNSKTIYVYRNLYDVLCSTYIYMQTFENKGKGVSIHDFIRQPFANSPNRVRFWVDEVQKKRSEEGTFFLSYEDILKSPSSVLDQLDTYLNLKAKRKTPLLPPKTYNKWNIRWQRFFSTYPNNTAILASTNGIKKLIPENIFSDEDFSFINDIASSTLITLGYKILKK